VLSDLVRKFEYLAQTYDLEAQLIDAGSLTGRELEKVCPVKHSFGDGCYVREWNSPAGMLVVSKLHKIAHPFFALKGDVSVITAAGIQRIVAPHYGITPAGTKRVLYTHTATQWVTVHVTNEVDIDKIEREIIASDVDELLSDVLATGVSK